MLLLNELVMKIRINEGQLLIPIDVFGLDKVTLEQMFVNTVRQYQNKVPNEKKIVINGNPNGVHIPDALSVGAIRQYFFYPYNKTTIPIPVEYKHFDENTRMLYTLAYFPYEVTYGCDYNIDYYDILENSYTTVDGESNIDLYLRGDFRNNIVISKNNKTMIFTSNDLDNDENPTAMLSGNLGTASINLNTLKTNLILSDTSAGNLSISYKSKYQGVKELHLGSLLFIKMFTAEFLTSLGTSYKLGLIDGLPINIDGGLLMERGRELQNEIEEMANNKSHWYKWGS